MYSPRFSTIIIISLIVTFNSVHSAIDSENSSSILVQQDTIGCFEDDHLQCLIQANLTLENGNILPVNVDCTMPTNETDTGQDFEYNKQLGNLFLNRFKNIRRIAMNGRCTNSPTFGLEHLHDSVDSVEVASFYNFEIDSLRDEMFPNIGAVEAILFENNTITNITRDAFQSTRFLRNLTFEQNHLKLIETGVFDDLKNLKNLWIHERTLIIDDEDFFVNMDCEHLTLAMNKIDDGTLQKLPESLTSFEITNMSFQNLTLNLPSNLTTLSVVENSITTVTIVCNSNLKLLNLSRNHLHDFDLINCTNIESLDLSQNRITYLRDINFHAMQQLKFLDLHLNSLKRLPLDIFEKSAQSLTKIDLTSNLLRLITIKPNFTPNPDLKIIVNRNPWDCRWILEISRQYPELYRIFQYEKYVSKINVNGLECAAYPSTSSDSTTPAIESKDTNVINHRSSNNARRNQKTQALYIMLVLVIAVGIISFILYLWVNCRYVFRPSFYRSLKRSHWSPERYDVIRRIPTDSSEYEIPLQFLYNHGHAEHVELLDTIGSLERIELPPDDIPEPVAIYEEIKERS